MDAEEATSALDAPVVVLGASGLLGRAVHAALSQAGHSVLATSHSRSGPGLEQVDLTSEAGPQPENETVWAFPQLDALLDRTHPRAIINCVAERRPDRVQADPTAAEALNVHLPHAVARWCAAQTEPPLHIHISTDYVFDGTSPPYGPDAPTHPLNAYGQSKARAEQAVLSAGPQGHTVVIRVPILYGKVESNGESAVSILLDAIRLPRPGGEFSKHVDANQTRYPTCIEDVARMSVQVLALPSPPPIVHISAQEAMTKYIMSIVLARIWNSARTRAWRELSPTLQEDGADALEEDEEEDGPAASTDHLEPLYEADPLAATTRPLNARLDVSANGKLGLSTEYADFETWWGEYLFEQEKQHVILVVQQRRQAAEERRKALAEETERKKREEEERLAREAAEAAASEERRKQEEAEAQQQREKEEAEAEERLQREKAEAEERRKKEEAEAEERLQRKKAEAEERRKKEEAEAEEHQRREETEADERKEKEERGAGEQAHPNVAAKATTPSDAREASPDSETTEQATEASDTADTVTDAAPAVEQTELSGDQVASLTLSALDTHPREVTPTSPLEEPEKMARAPSQTRTLSPDPSFNSLTAHPTPPRTSPLVTPDQDEGDDPKDDAPLGSLLAARARQGKPAGDADSDSERYGAPSPTTRISPAAPGLVEQPAEPVSTDAALRPTLGPDGRPPKAWFEIKVGDPQTVGAPMSAHTVYTVRTRTDSERFRSLQFSVLRRYSDFRWLHAALVHNHPGVIVPPVPEKVKLGRFNPELVEARRAGLELCINKIANHAELQKDDDFVLFLSSDNFAADVRARDLVKGPVPTPEQRTYLGWGSSLVSVAGAGGPRFVETDEWFDKQRIYLDSLEAHLRTLFKAVHTLGEQRLQRAKAEQELAKHYAALSTSSLSRATCTCFAGVGEVTALAARCGEVQAEADGHDLGVIVYEYERMVGSVRKAFQTREDAWIAWRRAADELAKIVAKHERLRDEGAHTDRRDLVEREAEVMHLHNRFETISRTCKSEVANFDRERIKDIRSALAAWVQGMIHRQQEMVHEWEEYAALVARQTQGHKPAPSAVAAPAADPAPTPAPGSGPGPASATATLNGQAAAPTPTPNGQTPSPVPAPGGQAASPTQQSSPAPVQQSLPTTGRMAGIPAASGEGAPVGSSANAEPTSAASVAADTAGEDKKLATVGEPAEGTAPGENGTISSPVGNDDTGSQLSPEDVPAERAEPPEQSEEQAPLDDRPAPRTGTLETGDQAT